MEAEIKLHSEDLSVRHVLIYTENATLRISYSNVYGIIINKVDPKHLNDSIEITPRTSNEISIK